MKTLIQTSKVLILSIAVLTAVSYVQAAWSNPTQSPTGGNTAAPINVSESNQNKNGGFTASALVGGVITSPEYCIGSSSDNLDCIESWPGGGGDTDTGERILLDKPILIVGSGSFNQVIDVADYGLPSDTKEILLHGQMGDDKKVRYLYYKLPSHNSWKKLLGGYIYYRIENSVWVPLENNQIQIRKDATGNNSSLHIYGYVK